MVQIFKNKLIIETTIFINSLIYFLKKIPLVGKLFKESLYGEKEGKLIFTILSALGKALSELAKKSLYIFVILNFIYGSLVRCRVGSSENIDLFNFISFNKDNWRSSSSNKI